jgi:hypothetical protein
MARWIAALGLAFVLATAVSAQPIRILPAGGKLGNLAGGGQAFPLVQIGGEVLRLSAGAVIYDQNNRTIVHAALPEHATVLYTQDRGGEVSRIYILRPDELERIRSARER